MQLKRIFCIFILLIISGYSYSQSVIGNSETGDIDYLTPRNYEIGGVVITGGDNLDHQIILLLTGLTIGDKIAIPGEKISTAIDKLWKQGIFEDVSISIQKIEGNTAFLEIELKQRPRLGSFKFEGINKSDANKLREKLNIVSGEIVTENLLVNSKNKIKQYYADKGYHNASVEIKTEPDTSNQRDEVRLFFRISKNQKIKIDKILVHGNESFTDRKVKKALKETKEAKWWRFWKSSRYIDEDFNNDLNLLIQKYNEGGFRDAKIVSDTVYQISDKKAVVEISIYEGKKYYFRNIGFVGNTKYSSDDLRKYLRIDKGTPYNKTLLDERIHYSPSGTDINSLYMDDGYLFFNAIPVEVLVENDSIDIEIRIREGKQARINKVTVSGNTRTNDHVIMRELKAYPGKLFSRDAVFIRSVRELSNLRYFDPQKIVPEVKPDPENGTVDINYSVEEVPSDQFELSGGWGAGTVIGSIGFTFNNFSTRNFFKSSAWRPLPTGDGQRLSFRAQTNGTYYYSFNGSFTEPWLGGKKANALTVSAFHSYQSNGFWENETTHYLKINGGSVSLGKRLKWPDDYFTFIQGVTFQQYSVMGYGDSFIFSDGVSNDLNYNITIARNSLDMPIYPRTGSDISLYLQLTPPYSLLNNRDYSSMEAAEKYKWLEYYKINFRAAWYFNIVENLVFTTRVRFGFLGYYNDDIGYSPFGRYSLGGDGLSGWDITAKEVIPLRGYGAGALSPKTGASAFNKFTLELRYPFILDFSSATIFGLAFAEGGNSWLTFTQFNPYKPYVAAGLGIRIYMPMFGMLGFDWGYGFDRIPGAAKVSGSQFHFSINQSID